MPRPLRTPPPKSSKSTPLQRFTRPEQGRGLPPGDPPDQPTTRSPVPADPPVTGDLVPTQEQTPEVARMPLNAPAPPTWNEQEDILHITRLTDNGVPGTTDIPGSDERAVEEDTTPGPTATDIPAPAEAQADHTEPHTEPQAPRQSEAASQTGDAYPPPDWRGGYDILHHHGLIRYLNETPDLTLAGARAAAALGLELTPEDWRAALQRATPATNTESEEGQGHGAVTAHRQTDAARLNPPEPDTDQADPPLRRVAPDTTPDTSRTPQSVQPHAAEQPAPTSEWRSLTQDRRTGGLPRRSYSGMPRPVRHQPQDAEIQALQRERSTERERVMERAVITFLTTRHHRTARPSVINAHLCGTLINGDEVFDGDITKAINTLVNNGRIVIFPNGDIFLLNPPDS